MLKLRNHFLTLAAGAALMVGSASYAHADAPIFTIAPSAIGAPQANFVANSFSGQSSELLTLTPGPNTASGSGWLTLTSFGCNTTGCVNGNPTVLPGVSGLGVNYGMYVTFSLTDTLVSGTLGGANSVYALTSLSFKLFADPNLNTTFQNAAAGTATPAVVTGTTSDDILLAEGGLVVGTAGFDSLG